MLAPCASAAELNKAAHVRAQLGLNCSVKIRHRIGVCAFEAREQWDIRPIVHCINRLPSRLNQLASLNKLDPDVSLMGQLQRTVAIDGRLRDTIWPLISIH